jgi:hypothetical protein
MSRKLSALQKRSFAQRFSPFSYFRGLLFAKFCCQMTSYGNRKKQCSHAVRLRPRL